MSKNSKQREFTFKYKFGGKCWSASVFADSVEEAKQKIRGRRRRFMKAKLWQECLYCVGLLGLSVYLKERIKNEYIGKY